MLLGLRPVIDALAKTYEVFAHIFWNYRYDWHSHYTTDPVVTYDGKRIESGYVMRRRMPDRSWQYRKMTAEEHDRALDEWA